MSRINTYTLTPTYSQVNYEIPVMTRHKFNLPGHYNFSHDFASKYSTSVEHNSSILYGYYSYMNKTAKH